MNEKIQKYLLFAIAIIGVAAYFIYFSKTGTVTAQKASEKAIAYINQNLLSPGNTAVLGTTTEEKWVYKIEFSIGTNSYTSYVSKDGKFLFPSGYDIATSTQAAGDDNSSSQNTQEITKSDEPDVKLFIMSYCPYGLQAEKMYLPVYNLLKDKATMGVYFVDYIMHGQKEVDENLRQYCIQKDQNAKYYNYLSCFVKTTAGEYQGCLTQAGIDTAKLNVCQTATDAQYKITANFNDKSTWLSGNYPPFNVSKDLNDQYGVQGSPTIVINGNLVNVSTRSPEAFKQVVCQAFNNPPAECSQTLSTTAASVSFGEGVGSSDAGAECAPQ